VTISIDRGGGFFYRTDSGRAVPYILTWYATGLSEDFFDHYYIGVSMRVEVFLDKSTKRWAWRVVARNGRTLAVSNKTYATRSGAINIATAILTDTVIRVVD